MAEQHFRKSSTAPVAAPKGTGDAATIKPGAPPARNMTLLRSFNVIPQRTLATI